MSLNRDDFSAFENSDDRASHIADFEFPSRKRPQKFIKNIAVVVQKSTCHSVIPPSFPGFMVSWFVSSGKFQESFSARSTAGCSASNRPGISMSRAPVPSSRNQSAFDVMPSSIHRSGVFAGERCLHISPIHQIDKVSKPL
jgi:hypothetical protein